MINVGEFLEKGYTLIPNAVPEALLSKWQHNALEIEKSALRHFHQGQQLKGACVVEDPVGPRLMRYNDLFSNHFEDLGQLLSSEPILTIIKNLSGSSSVVLGSDLMYKHQHPHPVVNWHQDAPHSRNHPYLNLGIYLDDADLDDGCLHFVPGSQHEIQDIVRLESKYGWNPPGAAQQPIKAGDVLVHDAMILHGSMPKRSPGVRRTVYAEVRPYEAILEDGIQDGIWADLRKEWMNEILKHDEEVFSVEEKAFFKCEGRDLKEIIRDLSEHRCPTSPANYNSFSITEADYPVPADLR